ncbi:putative ketoamine kinase [Carnimonas sp. R-84981]|uniref:fructosamine kinase family protein n=1 Tax=Carnimonas bestiolae TaxID=3402172 RepID=UPI003EDC6E0C
MPDSDVFHKSDQQADPALFATEAAGLEWLAEAQGARVARVIAHSATSLTIERIVPGQADRAKAHDFGIALATTHAAGAPAFGAKPPNAPGPQGFIGPTGSPLPMAYGDWASWGRFFAEARVLPFLRMTRDNGSLDAADARTIERAAARLTAGDFDDDSGPARIHGDLWSGNLLWSDSGAVLIDPAAHGGHPLDDLAMLGVFSAPFIDDIYAGYEHSTALPDQWRQRLPLHQLYPLLVHAVLFGSGYGTAAARAAQRFV